MLAIRWCFRHLSLGKSKRRGVGVKPGSSFVTVACLALLVAACEGTAAGGACTTRQDVGAKVTSLTDALHKAQSVGKIDAAGAGAIAARIVETGVKYGPTNKHRTYCEALDRIRTDTGI